MMREEKNFQFYGSWLLLLIFFSILLGKGNSLTDIKRKHLIIAASYFPVAVVPKRNSSGHITALNGLSSHMLTWLSPRYDFSYSILQTNSTSFEGSIGTPGLVSYLISGQSDVILGAIGTTYARLVLVDFSQGYLYTSNAFMIPMPDSSNNIAAIIQPFQLLVWIGVILVIPCVLAGFYFAHRFYPRINKRKCKRRWLMETSSRGRLELIKPSSSVLYYPWTNFFLYIFEVLFNQGGYFPDKRLALRTVATSWCLAVFVLITGYNSLLISYVTSPNAIPLIHSIKDLPNASSIHIVVDAGLGIDIVLSLAPAGIYKQLGDKVRTYEKSRCATTQQCIELVKSGSHVYINTLIATLNAMRNDFQSTGQCTLALAKEKEYATPWTWALAKRSPFTEYINRGILEMRGNGLIDIWTKWYLPDVRQCPGT